MLLSNPPSASSTASCSICIDRLKSPIALPCGHVYCHECILSTIQQVTPHTTRHNCPTCRSPYSTVNIDPSFVPAHLRQYITPGIRRLYMEDPLEPSYPGAFSGVMPDKELARILAENASLRTSCALWQRRAEVQAAATIGLIGLTRFARDRAVELKAERDDLKRRCDELLRKYEPQNVVYEPPVSSSALKMPSAPQFHGQPVASLLADVSSLQEHLRPSSPLGLSLISLPSASSELDCEDDLLRAERTFASASTAYPAGPSAFSAASTSYPAVPTSYSTGSPVRSPIPRAYQPPPPQTCLPPSPCPSPSPSSSTSRLPRLRSPRMPSPPHPNAIASASHTPDSPSRSAVGRDALSSPGEVVPPSSHSDDHDQGRVAKRRRVNEQTRGHVHGHAPPEDMSPGAPKRRKTESLSPGTQTPAPSRAPSPKVPAIGRGDGVLMSSSSRTASRPCSLGQDVSTVSTAFPARGTGSPTVNVPCRTPALRDIRLPVSPYCSPPITTTRPLSPVL
ncbi:hypothetical protein HGRIS_005166 [Hohenbuehelia grisea]|uniref:RING-type domain-containing protein n=1 Tax=Hohenbuehelia grisea TaxID=104357 RepID=A0ABR3JFS9_9AGAR